MAVQVKLDMFENTEPQPQWLNQLRVTVAMGKRYEQRGLIEKAAKCYETVVFYDPKDAKTHVRLSKCYQKMLQPEKAAKHQSYAKQYGPHLFETIENEAYLNIEAGNFEYSIMMYNKLLKQRKFSKDCQRGLAIVNPQRY